MNLIFARQFKIIGLCIFIICLGFVNKAFAIDYYWVGNGGNWSDISHWATTSGGINKHIVTPSANDNVIFDASSFSSAGQTIAFNNDNASSLNLDLSQVTNQPTFIGTTDKNLNVYGNINFAGNFIWNFKGKISLLGQGNNNMINFNGFVIGNQLTIDGTGSWMINGNFDIDGNLSINSGKVDFGSSEVKCVRLVSYGELQRDINWNMSKITIMGSTKELVPSFPLSTDNQYSCEFWTNNLKTSSLPNAELIFTQGFQKILISYNTPLNLGTIRVTRFDSLFAIIPTNGKLFIALSGNLITNKNTELKVEFAISGDLILSPNVRLQLLHNASNTVRSFLGDGTCSSPIMLSSTSSGQIASLKMSIASTNSFYTIRDIQVLDQTMNVANGIDLGNNLGITFQSRTAMTMYWIGNNGDWNNPSKWSFSSGGAPANCLPSAVDDVIFDQNSFSAANQAVNITSNSEQCKSMIWQSNVQNGASLAGVASSTVFIYGSLTFSRAGQNNFDGNFQFESGIGGNTIKSSSNIFKKHIIFNNPGGTWILQDNLECKRTIFLLGGTFDMSNQAVITYQFDSQSESSRLLKMNKSQMAIQFVDAPNYDPKFIVDSYNFNLDMLASKLIFTNHYSKLNIVNYLKANTKVSLFHFDTIQYNVFGALYEFDPKIMTKVRINDLILKSDLDINTTDTLSIIHLNLTAGKRYEILGQKKIISVDKITNSTLCTNLIYMVGQLSSGNTQATIVIKEDKPFTNYSFYNIKVVKSTPLLANNSIDQGLNSNIIFTKAIGRKLYWVEGSGDWNDEAHWSLNSNGLGGSCIPTPLDTVIFDQLSFKTPTDFIWLLNTKYSYSKDFIFDYDGFKGNMFIGFHHMFGNMDLRKPLNFTSILNIVGREAQTIFAKTSTFNYIEIIKNDTLKLLSPIVVQYNINLQEGALVSNNYDIKTNRFYTFSQNNTYKYIDLGTSTLEVAGSDFISNTASFHYIKFKPTLSTILFSGDNTVVDFVANAITDETIFNKMIFSNVAGTAKLNVRNILRMSNLIFNNNADINVSFNNVSGIFTDSLKFSAGKSYSVTQGASILVLREFRAIGNNCNSIKYSSSQAGQKTRIIFNPATKLVVNFVQLQDVAAEGAGTFNAGSYSTNVGNSSTGWFFPPRSATDADIGLLGPDLKVCQGASVVLDAFSNTSTETYKWSNNSTNSSISANNSGKYNVEVTFGNGCTIHDTIHVLVSPLPVFSLTPKDTFACVGQSFQKMVGVVSDSIIWQDGSRGNIYTISSNGLYKATAYINGCTHADSVRATFQPSPAINLGADTLICGFNSFTRNIILKTGETLIWEDGTSNANRSFNTAGTFSAKISNGTCISYDTLVVSKLDLNSKFLSNDTSICLGSKLIIKSKVNNVSYQWSTGSLSDSTIITTSGTYKLTITKETCIATDSIKVIVNPLPVVDNIPKSATICEKDTLRVIATGTFDSPIKWSDGVMSNTRSFTQSSRLGYLATRLGCVTSDSSIISQVIIPTFSLGRDTSICEGVKLPLKVNISNLAFLWSTGSTVDNILIDKAGSYTVRVSQGVCESTDDIIVLIKSSPVINIASEFTICGNETKVLTVVNNDLDSLNWSTGEKALTKSVNSASNLSIVAFKAGCQASKDVIVKVTPISSFDLGEDLTKCDGVLQTISLPDNISEPVTWSNGRTGKSIQISIPGTYVATISKDGCTFSDSITIREKKCSEFSIYFPNVFNPRAIGSNAFFMPTRDNNSSILSYNLRVYDRLGNLMYETSDVQAGWNGTAAGSSVVDGVYAYVAQIKYADDRTPNGEKIIRGTVMVAR
jgi:gliding motility-associated-like protein